MHCLNAENENGKKLQCSSLFLDQVLLMHAVSTHCKVNDNLAYGYSINI